MQRPRLSREMGGGVLFSSAAQPPPSLKLGRGSSSSANGATVAHLELRKAKGRERGLWPNPGMTKGFTERSQQGPVGRGAVNALTSTGKIMEGKGRHLREEGGLKTGQWVLETAKTQKVYLGEHREMSSRRYSNTRQVMQGLLMLCRVWTSFSKQRGTSESWLRNSSHQPALSELFPQNDTTSPSPLSAFSIPSCSLTLSTINIW